MLQAPQIAAAAGAELRDVVRAEIPEADRSGGQNLQEVANALWETDGFAVQVNSTGYIQYVDPETLIALATEKNLVIRLLHKPGHFVRRDMAVALVWPAGRVDDDLEQQIHQAFRLGHTRTPTQDVAYAVNQLVEMAVRAMSAAINDPFTAMTCLDYIGESLAVFVRQGEKDPYFYDQNGRLRLTFEPVTVEELFSNAFDMLRHCSSDNACVLQQMLKVIDTISHEAVSPVEKAGKIDSYSNKVRQALTRQVRLIQAESQAGKLIEQDRELIQRSSETLIMKLSTEEDRG